MKRSFLIIIISLLCSAWLSAQKVLDLPKCLDDPYKRYNLNVKLGSECGYLKNTPWIVYSDRGNDFGKKYYVVQEEETRVNICSASGLNGDVLINPVPVGWRLKDDLILKYSAEILVDAIIHKKCVVLNTDAVLQDIISGKIKESTIPLYNSPTSVNPIDSIPLYFIYFIYKTENDRYLIGSDFMLDLEKPIEKQIFGWVDAKRVYLYDTRICFEPNYDRQAIQERRCTPGMSAKVFEFQEEARKGVASNKPVWEEPERYYLYESDYVNDSAILAERMHTLCLTPNDQLFTLQDVFVAEYLDGSKFRFPLIQNLDDNVFKLGCTARYEDEQAIFNQEICKNLEENLLQLNIFFIIDNSTKDTRAYSVLEDIDKSYADFSKKYGVCYFPRPRIGDKKLALNTSYVQTRDYLRNFKATTGSNVTEGDNCFRTLDWILNDSTNFNDRQKTNVIILLNSSPVPELAKNDVMYTRLVDNIYSKHCYVIAFDYKENSGLLPQLQSIMLQVADKYARRVTPYTKPKFEPYNNGLYLYSGILAMLAQRNAALSTTDQVTEFLNNSHEKILTAINKYVNDFCSNSARAIRNEDTFTATLKDIAESDIQVTSVRALKEGYSTIRLRSVADANDMWKAEVLMTEGELDNLRSILFSFSSVGDNQTEQAQKIFDLWKTLANRFVGDQLDEKDILDLTPSQILDEIVRSPYGFPEDIQLKKIELRKIKEKDPEATQYFDEYISYVRSCLDKLDQIKNSRSLEFKNSDDPSSTISYFWIPLDVLP